MLRLGLTASSTLRDERRDRDWTEPFFGPHELRKP
jgi:hypothetical protein